MKKTNRQKLVILETHAEIICKNGIILIDIEDVDKYYEKTWHINRRRYVKGTHRNKLYLHRFLVGAKIGQIVDHKNRDTLDNRKSNLRICNSSQNNSNCIKRKNALSKYKGVSLLRRPYKDGSPRYVAYIDKNKKRKFLGVFKSEVEAAKVYNKYALQIHKEFARLNEI